MHAQSHRSDPRTLGRRTLRQDHRKLSEILRLGLSVLDIGCGTGAITAGIAEAVGTSGRVVGMDRDETLLEIARAEHASLTQLRFEVGDATAIPFEAEFDIVTAARVLQWVSDPAAAVAAIVRAAKPGGTIVVLDYNHSDNLWEPPAPPAFQRFYAAFLQWRRDNGWDNHIAARLPELFRIAGLVHVQVYPQDEVVERGEADFAPRTALWVEVIESVGPMISGAGLCTTADLDAAREAYVPWIGAQSNRQTLAMRTVTAIKPVAH